MPGQQKTIFQPKDKNIWQTIQIDELFNQRSKIYWLPKITSTYPSFCCMKQHETSKRNNWVSPWTCRVIVLLILPLILRLRVIWFSSCFDNTHKYSEYFPPKTKQQQQQQKNFTIRSHDSPIYLDQH